MSEDHLERHKHIRYSHCIIITLVTKQTKYNYSKQYENIEKFHGSSLIQLTHIKSSCDDEEEEERENL